MSEPMVRGNWAAAAVAFMGVHYSSDTNDRLLGGLPKDVRITVGQLEPSQWCPRSHHVELMKAIASAHRDERRAFEDLLAYGQYVGTEAAHGTLRNFVRVVTPKLFAKKLPVLWANDHGDDGRLESDIAPMDEGRLPLRLSGVAGYDHVGVAMLGWVKAMMSELSGKLVVVKQTGWSLRSASPTELVSEVTWS
jgi:hypothetical protein